MSRFARPARPARLLAAAAVATLAAACGGGDSKDPTGPAAVGSFSGNVAGAVARSLSGAAYYAQVTNQPADENGFVLGMGSVKTDGSFKDLVAFVRNNPALPAAGNYQLHNPDAGEPGANDFVLISTVDNAAGQPLLCVGTSGTLTVQSSSGGHVKGSYNAQALCFDPTDLEEDAEPATATLTGSFDAVQRANVSVPSANRIALSRLAAARAKR